MTSRQRFDLILLAALWGGSFMFMRYATPEFGAFALVWLRVAIAAGCLLPLLLWRKQMGILWENAVAMTLLGIFSTALPFVLIAWAMLSLTSGLASILNATTPIFTAIMAAWWLRDRLDRSRMLGLAIGFAGVLLLAADKAEFHVGGSGWALVAMLLATLSYGFGANLTRRHLSHVPPLANAAGSQLVSAVVLLPLAVWWWPEAVPSTGAWLAVLALGIGCTALAFMLFFRLIAQVGAARAITVTFLIPVFGIVWGGLFLHESVTLSMLLGGSVVVLGTALATGVLKVNTSRKPT